MDSLILFFSFFILCPNMGTTGPFLSLCPIEGATKFSLPVTHGKEWMDAAFALLCDRTLRSATSSRQIQPSHLGLSGKLMQRAMKQAHKLVYLKGCTLHI